MTNQVVAFPSDVRVLSSRQALFISYLLLVLVDLLVLNLFDEFWQRVTIESFTISLFVAVILQILLKLTIKLEHKLAAWVQNKGGKFVKTKRITATWLVLFISKIVILGIVNLIFGDSVHFGGVVPFIVVVVGVFAAEILITKVFMSLGNETSKAHDAKAA
jgi:hypothetical protein